MEFNSSVKNGFIKPDTKEDKHTLFSHIIIYRFCLDTKERPYEILKKAIQKKS